MRFAVQGRPPLPAAAHDAFPPTSPAPQNAAIVFLLPYLGILWREQGFTGSQIGILSTVRPFICSISGGCMPHVAAASSFRLPQHLSTWVLAGKALWALCVV